MPNVTIARTWFRPALMIFTDSEPSASVASIGQWDLTGAAGASAGYIYLTDDNRSDMQVSLDRLENKKRMINGTMRSYFIADKRSYSISWQDLPSSASFVSENRRTFSAAWAAGQEMLNWYNTHPDSFWMLLVYDTPNRQGSGNIPVRFEIEKRNVFFESFSYNVKNRGILFDHWDISMSLVEV
ncbi:MAG: hypothetical protein EB127_10550 [Alphaproteobacteria bacterium]|nr:hypothetical protein [Alphaproteobacteria bacterium]